MIFAIIQARMGSSRLPGKILMDLYGQPSLYRIYERLAFCNTIDRVLVATSIDQANDPVRHLCKDYEIPCYSGSEEDVLSRFFEAAAWIGASEDDILVRITGDCPLIDPMLVDKTVNHFIHSELDYVSNSNPPSYPDGLDCEVFRYRALGQAYWEASLQSEREHVTLFIRNHPERFHLGNISSPVDYSYLRWTLDEKEDYLVIRTIYENLYPIRAEFDMQDILALYREMPHLLDLNSMYVRNEGLKKSLEKEKDNKK